MIGDPCRDTGGGDAADGKGGMETTTRRSWEEEEKEGEEKQLAVGIGQDPRAGELPNTVNNRTVVLVKPPRLHMKDYCTVRLSLL